LTGTKAASARQEASLKSLYGPVLSSLDSVEAFLHRELQSQIEAMAPLLRHGARLGGKRMRPALVLLSARSVGEITPQHIAMAGVIEMVHTATLIHDDVLDEAQTRRHVPTINAVWNNHTSILYGDYLFAQSFRLTATHADSEVCAIVGEAARLVCEGELRQVLQRNALDLDEESYFEIIRGKTAELCRVACQLGASLNGADDRTTQALADYGTALGIAFQIADDYLDLWGDDCKVGKTLGTDLQQGKMTLPLIRLLATADESQRGEIVNILSHPGEARLKEIQPWLEASDARQYTAEVARRYSRQATESLSVLPDSAEKAALRAIAHFSVDRKF
jgi:octaprenyl-diphosphate synthase